MNNKISEEDKQAVKIVLWSYFKAFIIIAITILISFFIKEYLIDLSKYKYLSLIGTAIPTIGTLGFLTWHMNINTLEGGSFPEKLNRTILAITYIVGIILFILGL